MLTRTQVLQGRVTRRSMPSLKQQYQEYLFQRIENHKNSLPRDELLLLGDEAAGELHSEESQFVLTEVLMAETVDRHISKRLGLPSYKKWRKNFSEVRAAQRAPVHWGISSANPIVHLLPRLEPEDQVLVIGGGVHAEVCLLAAYDTTITFIDGDIASVDQLETRVAGESLSSRFHSYVASLGTWMPPFETAVNLVVIDGGTLAHLSTGGRHSLLQQAREVTGRGGVHVILPGDGGATPEAYVSHYPDWDREWIPGDNRTGKTRSMGVILGPPEEQNDIPRQAMPLASSSG